MEDKTTDNYIIKLKLATFISVLSAVIITAVHITRTISKIEQLEEKYEILDNRVTKTTGRNAKAIESNHEEIEKLGKHGED